MTQRRVFVIWKNPLFHESASLLLKHPDIDWVGSAIDYQAARQEIIKLKPDTILFEETGPGLPLEILETLDFLELRIIGLSLETNEINLYRREHQTILAASDLLQFVLDTPAG